MLSRKRRQRQISVQEDQTRRPPSTKGGIGTTDPLSVGEDEDNYMKIPHFNFTGRRSSMIRTGIWYSIEEGLAASIRTTVN